MASQRTRTSRRSDLWPGQIVLAYALVSLIWIFGSGSFVNLFTSGETSKVFEFAKGTGFVLVTAAGLYIVLARRARSIRLAEEARRAADAERLRLATAIERELAEAARMEAVGQLAGGIAHDFNNQLTAITGYADLLRAEVSDDPAAVQDVDQVLRAARSAAALVRQLLALARRQVLEPTDLQLGELLEQLQPMLRGLLGPRTELHIQCADGPSRVFADAGQIEQVLVNLTINAHDAMPRGGTFTIELSELEIPTEAALSARVPPGRYVVLTASDTGTGMDEATLARAFEPFFTTKGPGRGTGLGLSSAYGIVTQSGGHMLVESRLDVGTTFRIYLPQYEGPHSEKASATPEPVAGGRETILLVEDEEAIRVLAGQVLQKLGYRVLVCADAPAAMTTAASQRDIPLLVTDIRLPGLDGPSLAARLRLDNPGLRVLYVSGYASDAMVNSGVLSSEEAFLPKPFTGEELGRRVRLLLDAEFGRVGSELPAGRSSRT